jgi:ferredoxin
LVTYGNRNFEQVLVQFSDFLCERGFRPIAAAALVGEHSYSNAKYPIAVGRPDADDLASAEEFGKQIATKIQGVGCDAWDINIADDMPRLDTPESSLQAFRLFVQEYTRQQQENPVKVYPSASPEACSHCGVCVDVCPTQAISVGREEVTDTSRCIRCCACVKGCPSEARIFLSPFAKPLFENFQMRREPLYLL